MSLLISNFARNVWRRVAENRTRIIKVVLVLLVAAVAFGLVATGVSEWKERRHRREIQALDRQIRDKATEAAEAQARADDLAFKLQATEAELRILETQAKQSEARLETARTNVVILKQNYDQARNNAPLPISFASCADARTAACADLAAVEHPCR